MSNSRNRLVALVLASVLAVATLPLLAVPAGAVAPTSAPSDLAPAEAESVAGNPQLSWTLPLDAVRARVQVSVSPTYASLLFNEVTYNTTYTPITELPTGTIYWRVAGLDAGSGVGPWAESNFVKGLPGPNALAPADGAVLDFPTQTPSFTWTTTPSAKSYVLEVDDADDFIGASRYVTANLGYTPVNPLPAGALPDGKSYYWRVRGSSATNGTGVLTDWSPTRRIGVTWSATATLVKPAANEHVTDIEWTWDSVPGATAYNVQVDLDAGFTPPLALTATDIHSNRLAFRNALANAAYWWRVQPIDALGNLGSWSAPRQFTREWLAPPTLQLPAENAETTGDLRFQWSPVDHAARYEIQLAKDVNFSLNVDSCLTVQTSIYNGEDCANVTSTYPGGAFYWRVRALDDPASPAIIGVWSAARHHSTHTQATVGAATNPPAPVTTTNPPAACAGDTCTLRSTPTFRWNPSAGATSYKLYLAVDPNFTTVVDTITVAGTQTAYMPIRELPDNDAGQSYYWFVRPCGTSCGPDPAGAFPALPSNQFRKASAPVKLLTPANGSTISYSPRFEWQDYLVTTSAAPADPGIDTSDLEARAYQIQVSSVPTFATLLDDKIVDQTFFTPWDRTYPEGPLYWRVRAIDGSQNNLAWSENAGSPAAPWKVTQASPSPTQTTPANGATVQGTPTLKWNRLPHSAAYEFEVYKNGDANYSPGNRVLLVSTAHLEWTPVGVLAPGDYTWRIRRKDADNRVGAWSHEAGSTPRTFTVGSGTGPTLVGPVNGSLVGDDVVFTWNPVPRAATYRFQRSTTSTFASVTQKDTVMAAWAPPEKVAQGIWYWRVLALDAGGNVMTTSATRTVTKDVLPGAPANVTAAPRNTAATVSWTTPPPTGGTAITGYVITPYIGSAAQAQVQTNAPTPTSITVTGLTNGTAYTFRVAAKIAGAVGPQSSASAPVTPTAGPIVAKSQYVPINPCRVVDTRSKGGILTAGATRQFQVGGSGTQFAAQGGKAGGCLVPDGATAVEASITAIAPTGAVYLRAWPNGQAQPTATFLNATKGKNVSNTGAIALAPTGVLDLAVANFAGSAHYTIDIQGYFVTPDAVPSGKVGSVYVAITPCRVVDTRFGGGSLTSGATRDFQVGGSGTGFADQGGKADGCAVPDGAAAVEASVTAVSPTGVGSFRAWAIGDSEPNTTFISYTKVSGVTNTGSLKLGATGVNDLRVRNSGSTAHYVVDIQGYFVPLDAVPVGKVGTQFVPLTPCRVLDTRVKGGALTSNETRSYQVGGSGSGFAAQGGKANGCLVPDGAAAVEATVTAASPNGSGYFRAWPFGQAQPTATFLNFAKAESITNTGAITLAATGTQDLSVENYSVRSHYVVDVQGYYAP